MSAENANPDQNISDGTKLPSIADASATRDAIDEVADAQHDSAVTSRKSIFSHKSRVFDSSRASLRLEKLRSKVSQESSEREKEKYRRYSDESQKSSKSSKITSSEKSSKDAVASSQHVSGSDDQSKKSSSMFPDINITPASSVKTTKVHRLQKLRKRSQTSGSGSSCHTGSSSSSGPKPPSPKQVESEQSVELERKVSLPPLMIVKRHSLHDESDLDPERTQSAGDVTQEESEHDQDEDLPEKFEFVPRVRRWSTVTPTTNRRTSVVVTERDQLTPTDLKYMDQAGFNVEELDEVTDSNFMMAEDLLKHRRKRTAKAKIRRFGAMIRNSLYWMAELQEMTSTEGEGKTAQTLEVTYKDGIVVRYDKNDYNRPKVMKPNTITMKERGALYKFPWDRKEEDLQDVLNVVNRMTCFERYPQDLRKQIAEVLHYEVHDEDKVLLRQGHNAYGFYFLMKGKVQLQVKDYSTYTEQERQTTVSMLEDGSYFGELALLYNQPRTATVLTRRNRCEFGRIDKEDFDRLLRGFHELELARRLDALADFEPCKRFSREEVAHLNILSRFTEIQPGKVVFGNAPGYSPHLYFIVGGTCDLVRSLALVVNKSRFDYVTHRLANAKEVATLPWRGKHEPLKTNSTVLERHFWIYGKAKKGANKRNCFHVYDMYEYFYTCLYSSYTSMYTYMFLHDCTFTFMLFYINVNLKFRYVYCCRELFRSRKGDDGHLRHNENKGRNAAYPSLSAHADDRTTVRAGRRKTHCGPPIVRLLQSV